jgi:2-oxoglutarate ferredoxin oxidoreductase subunit beta
MGYPVRVCELLQSLGGVAFLARSAVDTPKGVVTTKKYMRKAFDNAINRRGFSLVEVLSPCPTNWGMTPMQALAWLRENMIEYYKLGVFKDTVDEHAAGKVIQQ